MKRGQRHADKVLAPVSLEGESNCIHSREEQRIQKEREGGNQKTTCGKAFNTQTPAAAFAGW